MHKSAAGSSWFFRALGFNVLVKDKLGALGELTHAGSNHLLHCTEVVDADTGHAAGPFRIGGRHCEVWVSISIFISALDPESEGVVGPIVLLRHKILIATAHLDALSDAVVHDVRVGNLIVHVCGELIDPAGVLGDALRHRIVRIGCERAVTLTHHLKILVGVRYQVSNIALVEDGSTGQEWGAIFRNEALLVREFDATHNTFRVGSGEFIIFTLSQMMTSRVI